jgi:signal transduction histidine kinase
MTALSRRSRVVVAAFAVFLATIALRTHSTSEDAVLALNTIPVVLIAFEFGLRGGVLAATLALCWVIIWHGVNLSPLGYFSRGLTYLATGAIVGLFVDRLRAAQAAVVLSERRVAELARGQQEQYKATATERERLARELHDVVAHSVSVMTVQSTAARRVIEDDPSRAAKALEAIERTGRDAMAEMRRVVSVLRPRRGGELTPQPGIDDIPAMVEQMESAGLQIDLRIEGESRGVPAALELSAYRILQEALTNTLKHAGPVGTEVVVRFGPRAIELECLDEGSNSGPAPTGAAVANGHGLIGMRERATLLGGEVTAGPRDGGGYKVHARLPL